MRLRMGLRLPSSKLLQEEGSADVDQRFTPRPPVTAICLRNRVSFWIWYSQVRSYPALPATERNAAPPDRRRLDISNSDFAR